MDISNPLCGCGDGRDDEKTNEHSQSMLLVVLEMTKMLRESAEEHKLCELDILLVMDVLRRKIIIDTMIPPQMQAASMITSRDVYVEISKLSEEVGSHAHH